MNAQDANYVIHLRGQPSTADTPPPPCSPRRRQQSGVRNLEVERSHYTEEEGWVGEGWEGKDETFIRRHLGWNREEGREECEEGWRGGPSRATNLRNADSRGGEREWNMGKQRKGRKRRSWFGEGNFDSDNIKATLETLREEKQGWRKAIRGDDRGEIQ